MSRIWMPGGGGGADLDVVTAAAGDILKGKVIVGPDGEPLTGVLELTGTAADSQVLEGKTYYNTNAKSKRTGTLINRGAVLPGGLNAGGSYTIPEGYHNGSGKVTANSLASQTDATAGAGDILSGKTAWAKGSKITGTIAIQGAKTASLNCGDSYTIPAGYHNGSGKVSANSLASQTSADAAAGHILSGKTAWVNGSKVTGNIASLAGQTITPSKSQQSVSCSGKYMTGNIVINAIPSDYVPFTHVRHNTGEGREITLPINLDSPYNIYILRWKYNVSSIVGYVIFQKISGIGQDAYQSNMVKAEQPTTVSSYIGFNLNNAKKTVSFYLGTSFNVSSSSYVECFYCN